MNVEWTTRMSDDVTFVEIVVTNDGPPRRVRVSNELDGPVWPPRQQGVPATGWNGDGYEGVIEDRCALGYSSPAPSIDPPVSVKWLETVPVQEEQRFDYCPVPVIDSEPTPNSVYRVLSDPRPPRDAVPVTIESVVDDEMTAEREQNLSKTDTIERNETTTGYESIKVSGRNRFEPVDERERTQDIRVTNYPAVESLFRTIERRVDDGEMLTEVETLPDATWAVETVGGLTAVADLMTALDADRETLRAIEARAALLRKRAETIDVPVDTLERLA
jgi:hypothetical protein